LTTYGDRIYFDDTFLAPSYNTMNSASYVQPDGTIQPAASLWDMRALIRRGATSKANRHMVHMTNAAVAPVIGFAASQLDWETGSENAVNDLERDFQDRCQRWRTPTTGSRTTRGAASPGSFASSWM
jgi:hypothetical protein